MTVWPNRLTIGRVFRYAYSNTLTIPAPRRGTASSSAGPQSVGRVISVLEHLAVEREGATLTELAAFVGAPKTSLVGLLNAMVRERCLRREESGRYLLGERIHAFVAQAAGGQELSALAHPILEALVEATGETALLGAVAEDADLVVYLDRVESDNPVRYTVKVGDRREMHCTATGKVLLAFGDPARARRLVARRGLERFTPTTITSPAELRAELERIRREAIARTDGERVAGASGVAAPVFGAGGRVVAALLVAGPSERVKRNRARIEREVVAGARRLSRMLGGVAQSTAPGGEDAPAGAVPRKRASVKRIA